ncbi:hypothetical protein CsSME_00010988 [Camellia sinensis var. sinensis]
MPSRGLSFINNTFKSLQFTKEVRKLNSREEEDDPLVKLFPCKLRIWSNRKLPSDFGIDPINAFLPSSKVVSLEAFEIDSGIIPVSLFSPRSRILRLGSQSPILDGRLLDKLFSCLSIFFLRVDTTVLRADPCMHVRMWTGMLKPCSEPCRVVPLFVGFPKFARHICVDTPFFTVLKIWTSPFERSVIIHVRVRFEFPEASATHLVS